MARFRAEILVRPRSGVLDPQAEAIGESLASLGYRDVRVDWVGRRLAMTVESSDGDGARRLAEDMCDRILVNPNLETHEILVERLADGSE